MLRGYRATAVTGSRRDRLRELHNLNQSLGWTGQAQMDMWWYTKRQSCPCAAASAVSPHAMPGKLRHVHAVWDAWYSFMQP